jgi:hypothetical protein
LGNLKSELASGISILLIFSIIINQSSHFHDGFPTPHNMPENAGTYSRYHGNSDNNVNNKFPPRPHDKLRIHGRQSGQLRFLTGNLDSSWSPAWSVYVALVANIA